MSDFDWLSFLNQWSTAILASPDREYFNLPQEAVESGWLGFPGATDDQIAAVEARIGIALPPSYQAFLKASNGWRHTGTFIERLLPVEQIHWARETTDEGLAQSIDIWLGAMDGIPVDDEEGVDYRHFPDTLVIAEPTDEAEVYLLNPQVVTPAGEWQAWAFAHWIPGAEAYESFQALLEFELDQVLDTNQEEAQRVEVDDPPEVVAAKLPNLIKDLEEKAAFYKAGAELSINAGTYEGLQEVVDRLHALERETMDPAQLRERLLALAQELEAKHAEIVQRERDAFGLPDPSQLALDAAAHDPITALENNPALNESIARMLEFAARTAQAGGYMQGAATIRYFLKAMRE